MREAADDKPQLIMTLTQSAAKLHEKRNKVGNPSRRYAGRTLSCDQK
jgi:hypothetical protein